MPSHSIVNFEQDEQSAKSGAGGMQQQLSSQPASRNINSERSMASQALLDSMKEWASSSPIKKQLLKMGQKLSQAAAPSAPAAKRKAADGIGASSSLDVTRGEGDASGFSNAVGKNQPLQSLFQAFINY